MGCSCCPSPAFTTLARVHSLTRSGTPEDLWRTTITSTPMASMVSTVSRSDSPFSSDDVEALKDMTSAERRLAAVSNERRVRVEGSKKSVATVFPRSAGTFGMGRSATSLKASARWRMSSMLSRLRSAIETRWRVCPVSPAPSVAGSPSACSGSAPVWVPAGAENSGAVIGRPRRRSARRCSRPRASRRRARPSVSGGSSPRSRAGSGAPGGHGRP